MKSTRSLLIGSLSVLLPLAAAWLSGTAAVYQTPTDIEAEIHLAPGGADTPGEPVTADPKKSGKLKLTVFDAETGQPAFCRVNVVGSDGNYYEPTDNSLSEWSLHRLGNRKGKGPVRYYGWFFYSDGQCEIAIPPGTARIEVWKGFEYKSVTVQAEIVLGKTTAKRVKLNRTADMAARGWFSGDTHIHLNRRDKPDDERALDLAAVEDIRFAHILCMNDTRFYKPTMDQQIWFQNSGLGKKSERSRGIYNISSGQEYRCGTFGHICLVGGSRLVDADGLQTNPNNWPVFGMVGDETRSIGGYSFHAHGGYEREIYADFVQQATDGVELLQFAVYRGIALEGWYHILNAGFRFPAVGASDYPYCRALGDCRTYVYLGAKQPSFDNWNKAAAEGHSFFTTGPLLEVSVNGKRPGETVELNKQKQSLSVTIQLTSPVAAVDEIHLIEAGQIKAKKKLKGNQRTEPLTWNIELLISESTWVAVRAFSKSQSNRENVEAHTNPVYVSLNGGKPFHRDSVMWLIKKLDERIAFHSGRNFKEKQKVLAYFNKSRKMLLDKLR